MSKLSLVDIDCFTEYLTGLGLKGKTVRLYVGAVQRAERVAGPLETVTAVGLADYVASTPAGYSTRRHLRTALARYWEMVGRVDGPLAVVRIPPKPRARCRALSEDDAEAMVKTALGWYPEGLAALFGFYLALRTIEIARTHTDRFDESMGWYRVTGKNDVTADLPVHAVLAEEVRRSGMDGWLFPGHRGRDFVSHTTVWKWVQAVREAAGVDEHVWPHRLRHTALAHAYDSTKDLRAVAEFARHRDTNVTLTYTRTTEKNLRQVAAALDYV